MHEDRHAELRGTVASLARRMLAGDEDLVAGCRAMNGWLSELGADRLSEELSIFVAVDSEADALPIGVAPVLLEPSYRERCEREQAALGDFYKAAIFRACEFIAAGGVNANLALQRTPHRRGASRGIMPYLGGAGPLSFVVRPRKADEVGISLPANPGRRQRV